MKILIVTAEPPRPPKNGVGRYVRDLKKSLGELAEVKVLSLQMDPFVQLDDEEIEKRKAGEYVPEFNSNPTKKLYFMDFAFRFENDWYSDTFEARHMLSTHHAKPIIKGVIAKFQPDIIYLNSMKVYWPFRYMNNLVIGFHAMTTSITGEEIYSSETMAMIRWEREVMERSLGTVVFSQKVKQEIIEKYNQKDNVHVLPCMIDLSDYSSTKEKRTTLNVAYYGRMDKKVKGSDLFLEAVTKYNEAKPDAAKYHVYGDNQDEIDFDQYPFIEYHGIVSDDDLLQAYKDSDIVVMPSTYEPFGLVGLEAMASGCLLLAPRGQGMDEYLTEDNHIRIEAKVESITEVLQEAIENHDKYTATKAAGVKTAAEWKPSEIAQKTLNLLKRLLETTEAKG